MNCLVFSGFIDDGDINNSQRKRERATFVTCQGGDEEAVLRGDTEQDI